MRRRQVRRLMPERSDGLAGAGLGLRRALLGPLLSAESPQVDFLEVAPENWIGVGGRLGRQFRELAARQPMVLHGLSLDIGGPDALDTNLVKAVRALMQDIGASLYTEHLTYCAADGHLYDLLPIPFTEEAVTHVVERVQRVQDIIGEPIALENASYYAQPHAEMSEAEFITSVVRRAGCDLLLDVNNIYVNSINHSYSPCEFLQALPLDRVRYIHVAGHYDEAPDLKVDTHGASVIAPVWSLLAEAYSLLGPLPTLLERDFNLPPLSELLLEVEQIRQLQHTARAVVPGRAHG